MDVVDLLSLSDLVGRWVYTRQGIQKLIARDRQFPRPAATVGRRRQRLWPRPDIVAYEASRPWLTSKRAKAYKAKMFLQQISRDGGRGRRET